jgi:hypothetical protein
MLSIVPHARLDISNVPSSPSRFNQKLILHTPSV